MKPIRNIFSCVFLAIACVLRAEDTPTPGYQLLSRVEVDSTGIYLDQIAVPTAASAALPHLRLAQSPSLGQTASFSRNQITELAQKCSGLITTNWSGATLLRVSRRTRQFTDSDLLDMLTSTLQKEFVKNRGELELHLARPWTAVAVPDEKLTLKISELPSVGVTPNFIVNCELWNGRERVGAWEVGLQASVWRDVPVARSPLRRGDLLKTADIAMERRDVLLIRDVYLNFPNNDDRYEIAEIVQPEAPVLNRSVRERPAVLRGHIVEGVFKEGALSISLKVEVLEDGLLGQTVRVRNPKTKRELYGKVQNEETVLIAL